MRIENKNRVLVPFTLKAIQANIDETATGRDVYVKPSQIGASSYFICDYLIDTLTIPGTTSILISYDEFISGRLLRKVQMFYDYLLYLIPTIPKMHHRSTSEKTFPEINGSFYISSARSFSGVRGEPIHNLLMDEFGFWQPGDAARVFAAAMQRVPLELNTKVKIVSTPNGEDNDFYNVYMAAKEGRKVGKSVFTAHFYRWFDHEEYRLSADNIFALPGDEGLTMDMLDTEEHELVVFQGLDFDQIRWRRYKMAEMDSLRRSGETRLIFKQEYPEDDISCFQTAGDMAYDVDILTSLARGCYPAPIHNLGADIWFPPEEGLKYLVAIDPGVGKQSESVATVWNFSALDDSGLLVFRHCATLSGYYDEEDMANRCMPLAVYYNNALIANEDSLGFTAQIKTYPDLYYRTDPISGKVGRQIGWQTTRSTKPYMITEVSRHLPKVETHDIRIVSQCRNIRWDGGRIEVLGADDYHDSLAIAIVCREALPVERGLVGTAGWSDDWGRR